MGKKILALLLAAALTAPFGGKAAAEEVLIIEEMSGEQEPDSSREKTAVSDGEILEGVEIIPENDAEEPQTDPAESGTEAVQADPAESDAILFAVEEVETKDYGAGGAELTQEVSGQLSASGGAAYACLPRTRSYSSGGYSGSFGNQLSGNARAVYDAMVSSYVTQSYINGTGYAGSVEVTLAAPVQFHTLGTVNSQGWLEWDRENNAEYNRGIVYAAQAAYDAFIYDYPQVFWMGDFYYSASIAFSHSEGSWTGSVSKISLVPSEAYSGASGEIGSMKTAVWNAENQIRGQLSSAPSREEILRGIHDYLCGTLSYGETAYAHSAAGAFLKGGTVVCEGYAKAFKILCGQFGVECVLVVGYAGEAHMWNYVRMEDNNWYLVDVTWDDLDTVSYDYFLAGSGTTVEGTGSIIATERTIYSNFSRAVYTESFSVPILSGNAYQGNTHGHTWKTVSEQPPTCQKPGYRVSECIVCGERSGEILDCVEHSFSGKTYVSNHDATWEADGTRTELCDYGCGTEGDTLVEAGTKLTPTMKLNVTSLTLKKGQSTSAVKVSGLLEGDSVVKWKSSNTKIVKVNSKTGKITAQKKTGTARITVMLKSGYSKSFKVKVQSETVRTTKITGVPKTLKLAKGKKKALEPKLTPLTTQQKVTYSSSNRRVATVSSSGVITAKKAGKVKITVRSGSKKVTVTVTVLKTATKKITNVPAAITMKAGKTRTLKPKRSPAASDYGLTYKSSNPKVASVSAKGKITAKKKGSAVITVKSGKISVKCTVKVR